MVGMRRSHRRRRLFDDEIGRSRRALIIDQLVGVDATKLIAQSWPA